MRTEGLLHMKFEAKTSPRWMLTRTEDALSARAHKHDAQTFTWNQSNPFGSSGEESSRLQRKSLRISRRVDQHYFMFSYWIV